MPDHTPRIFVSHSHRDDAFTTRLVEDLRRAGAEVWVDMTGMDPGVFMQRISQALDTFDVHRCNTHGSETSPVGAYAAGSIRGTSPYGAQDMSGNAWEWTRTIFDAQAYSSAAPREDNTSEGSRVLRGGSWRNGSGYVRAACRISSLADIGDTLVGFRLILDSGPSSA